MTAVFLTGRVTVELTERHITAADRALNGRLSRECNCPVAHAVADAGFENPRVRSGTFTAGDTTGYLHSKGKRRRYALPPEVATFIEHYDDNRPVDPFTFTVDADDYVEVFYE